MSLVNYVNWIDAGNGVFLQCQDHQKNASDLATLFANIKEREMIYIKLLQPERFPIAVDTGVRPYFFAPGTVLLAQVSDLRASTGWIRLDCDCRDEAKNQWYTMEIAIYRDDPSMTDIKTTARLQPIKNFGAPAPNMQAAFAEFHRRMLHPPEE